MKFLALTLLCAVAQALASEVYENGCPKDYEVEQLLPHPECNKFYQCWHGELVVHACPSDLYFSVARNRCEWKRRVDCDDREVPEEIVDEPAECDEVPNNERVCIKNNYGSGNADASKVQDICAADESDGILVAHENCNQFYICNYGKPVAMDCPRELQFNPSEDKCDWSHCVECGNRNL